MNEAELLEISHAIWANAISVSVAFITILSGYLVAAYLVGKSVTSGQTIIINSLYIGLSTFLILSFLSFAINADELEQLAFAMTSQRDNPPRVWLSYSVAGFLWFCHVASLKFMWDIRHPKAE